ncbi:MAG TPA: phosphotransferase family protein [Acidimicrobiia bacterium]|nr:phosphotransferase family protein [Acidimicrobiia bacterium]
MADDPSAPAGVDAGPDGIDRSGVTAWLQAHVPEIAPPLSFSLIAGGRSNLTFTVTDSAGRRFVLRRPPLGHLLPSAHDMGREHRVIAALGPSPVPVPPLVGLCADETVTGAPFYVMHFVDGVILRDPDAAATVPETIRRAASESLVDVLADLHRLDPASVGLGDLGRQTGYVERLIRRWRGQWDQGRSRDLPLVDEVAERLAARIPETGPASIVHGDYRLDNAMVSPADGSVQAVLDWELCTLGDPLADLGMLLVYWTEPGDQLSALSWAPTTAPGFIGRKEVAARYGAASGRDLSELDYYVALAYWKIAVILEGVYVRYRDGAYGDTDDSWRAFEHSVPQLAEAAHEAATRAGR